MSQANVLVIEDDEIVAKTVEQLLRRNDYQVGVANSGRDGLRAARRNPPDLVLLDVIMPGMDGYMVCKEMRADQLLAKIPILFLTAKIREEDTITGLSAGADDYLGKPFNIEELLLRVSAILRRTRNGNSLETQPGMRGVKNSDQTTRPTNRPDENCRIRIGEYELNTNTYEFSSPERGIFRVTPVQYTLLHYLMTHPNMIFSPMDLLEDVWNYPKDMGSSDLVRVHIKNLRDSIEINPKVPEFIKTIQGYGYTIQAPEQELALDVGV